MLKEYSNVAELLSSSGRYLSIRKGRVHVQSRAGLAAAAESLAFAAGCGSEAVRETARFLLREGAQDLGILPSSIQGLYTARGRGEVPSGFTVPANNLRCFTFDAARAVFRIARESKGNAILFEIARSEMGYTNQRPDEYVAVLLAAAIAENHKGPVFVQGDHIQVNAAKYKENPEKEIADLKSLCSECVAAGFYNIDIDASTIVDLDKPSAEESQRDNGRITAEMTAYIRKISPKGITVSIGGEIGEVGARNSNAEDLHAFMKEYRGALLRLGDHEGISKISIQTGTSHGGVVLVDGSIAEVKIAFDVLDELSHIAREEDGMAGAVQHGASTLPDECFHKFVSCDACEVHLATAYQNIAYETIPDALRRRIYSWLDENAKSERKPKDSDEQFYYKARKKALGPFKRELWMAPNRAEVAEALEEKFRYLFEQLRVPGTAKFVKKSVKPVKVASGAVAAAETVAIGADEPGE